ncbi:MAG: TonB-dependent receptor, partial [Gammaproteobacteria bacterium]
DRESIAALRAIHPSELRVGAPGLWISRGSGQEHLLALRSPVLTGAGACGAFLYLDNGVPVRPTGLCNVNQLFEVNLEQADGIEVLRGPGPVRFGSNALHGVIHARSAARATRSAQIISGPDDFLRATLDLGTEFENGALRVRALAAHDGGFRADSGYGLGKLNVDLRTTRGDLDIEAHLASALLNQETAGFIRGENAFADPAIAFTNPNPEAYRDAQAHRLHVRIGSEYGTVTPYLRHSTMAFLQHFLPGQPLEKNRQTSAGVNWQKQIELDNGFLDIGATTEWSDMALFETQDAPVQIDSAFLRATRPVGDHYDFDVRGLNLGVYALRRFDLGERDTIELGARAERVAYRYTTALAPGNNDANGDPCGFGGCLFTRPASRDDAFFNFAPKLSWQRRLSPQQGVFASLKRGFRAPQITELYRLQSGQQIANLDAETLDSVELGWRIDAAARASIAVFGARKRDQILRDADGFNLSNGKTRHYGIEFDAQVPLGRRADLQLSATIARHRYDFTRAVAGAEPITRGDDVDTAPRALAALRLTLRPAANTTVLAEWEHMGSYFLNASNAQRYGGHDLLHAVVTSRIGPLTYGIKVRNVLDRPYAERADFAFGSFRYFPGQPRSVFLTLSYAPAPQTR